MVCLKGETGAKASYDLIRSKPEARCCSLVGSRGGSRENSLFDMVFFGEWNNFFFFFLLWIPNFVHKMTEVVPLGAKVIFHCSLLPRYFLTFFFHLPSG